MNDVVDVLERAAQWQALLQARDVEGVGEFIHEDYAPVLVVPTEVTVPLADLAQALHACHRGPDAAGLSGSSGLLAAVRPF